MISLSPRKKLVAALLAGTIGLGLALPSAFGEQTKPTQPNQQQRTERFCQDAPARHAGWASYAEAKLKITAEQKAAWSKFVEDVKASRAPMEKLMCGQAATTREPGRPTLSKRLEREEQFTTARLESIKLLRPAVERLNAVLTAEQKTQLDRLRIGAGQQRHHARHQGMDHGKRMNRAPQQQRQ
ncbi:MAG: Spy/CpxP family protein refolding chaperone [Alphaproteobacteria bacterium]